MKKIIFFALTFCMNSIVAQPTLETIDIMRGSTIEFGEILSQDSVLVIDNWLASQNNNKVELYILQRKHDKNNPFSSFSIKRSEVDNTYKYMYFIFEDDLMTIKMLKNKGGLHLKIKKINFTKGTYVIDLEKLSCKYGEKVDIEIDKFPFLN